MQNCDKPEINLHFPGNNLSLTFRPGFPGFSPHSTGGQGVGPLSASAGAGEKSALFLQGWEADISKTSHFGGYPAPPPPPRSCSFLRFRL